MTALFVALQIVANHPQMSYYFLFVMLFMAIAYGVMAWREKMIPQFIKASVVLVVAGLLGVCVNLSNLYHTYEYSKETMRGKSELVKENSANQTNSGLERSYITQWSYGIGETFSLLVPNVKGGASVPLAQMRKPWRRPTLTIWDCIVSWDSIGGTAGYFRSGIRRCFCYVPLHSGIVYRKRTDEVGTGGWNRILHITFLGT